MRIPSPLGDGPLRHFALLSVALHGTLALAVTTLAPGAARMPQFAVSELSVMLSANAVQNLSPTTSKKSFATAVTNPTEKIESQAEALPEKDDASSSSSATGVTDTVKENHLTATLTHALDKYFLYPALARKYGWEGKVSVRVRLEPDGRLVPLHVVSSSGYAVLDRDAMNTLARIGAFPEIRQSLGSRPYETDFPIVYRLDQPRPG